MLIGSRANFLYCIFIIKSGWRINFSHYISVFACNQHLMLPLSYPLFFSVNTVPVIPITIWVKETTNFCISLRIYLWKMPCGKGWKWHWRETKFRNFLEEHPSLKCLQRSNFSSRAYTFKISCYAPVEMLLSWRFKMIVKKIEPHWPLGEPDGNVVLSLPASHIPE